MTAEGPIPVPVVVSVDPSQHARKEFRALAKKSAPASDCSALRALFIKNRKTLTPKDLGYAILEATEKVNGEIVSFFLKECGESEIDFEDLLKAFEISILIDNQKTLGPFHKHFAKGASPRTPKQKKEHLETLHALQIANGDLAMLQGRELSAFSIRKALWVTALSGNVARFQTILQHPRTSLEDKRLALEKAVDAYQTAIVKTLLLHFAQKKEKIGSLELGLALEKAAEKSYLPTIQVLYAQCEEDIPLNSVGIALEKTIDNDKYNFEILAFLVQKHGQQIEAHFIETALQAAVWHGKVEAFNLLLGLKNTGPEQRKQAIIAAFKAKKEEIFNDPRFTLKERVFALGLSAYLLKLSEGIQAKRPLISKIVLAASRLTAAIVKAWKPEPPTAVPMKSAPTIRSKIDDPAPKGVLRFSVPSATAPAASEKLPPPAATKAKKSVGFNLS